MIMQGIPKLGFLTSIIVMGICFGTYTYAQIQDSDEAQSKVSHSIKLLERAYIEDIDYEEVAENAIVGMLKELDPHSVYISADEIKKMTEPLKGNFEGIGVQFNMYKDTIMIVSVVDGGPSYKQGIQPFDKIITIDGQTVAGVGFESDDVVKALKGTKGTEVNVGVQRMGVDDIIDITITRDKIPIYSLDASYMVTPNIGYIKINRFSATTISEFHKALSKLKKNGMENLILDLKGNGGGYLKTAVDLADQFLKDDKLITYTEGRKYPRQEYTATKKGGFESGRLVVLLDEGSASASEIVAGAIQDWDRGLTIGRRSFGKGLVQKPFKLNDGSAIRLTIAHYYTPTGRSIQKPYEDGVEAYRKDISERFERGEMTDYSKIDLPDSLKFETLVKKRTVFGGGGILPDIFVPIDTISQSEYYKILNKSRVFNNFVLDHLHTERKQLLKQYKKEDDFIKNYTIDDTYLQNFTDYALEKEEIEKDEEGLEQSKTLITTRLKALTARYLYDLEAFYQVINTNNQAFLTAIKVMNDDDTFGEIDFND